MTAYLLILVVVLSTGEVRAVERTPFPSREECEHAIKAATFVATSHMPGGAGMAIAAFCAPAVSP
jgi:hypothetical protein